MRESEDKTELVPGFFRARDGVKLAYREMGEGQPLVLIHGYFSTATVNWVRYGHARAIAAKGFRVIMPDLRAHGDSDKPHDATAYPPDVLADDGFALVNHLGLGEYHLGGYSLGARTAIRMLVKGASPLSVVLGGMGLEGLLDTAHRGDFFRRVLTNLGTFERSSAEWMAEAFLKTVKGDPEALLHVLDTFVDTAREEIARITPRSLVVIGADDRDNGSADALAKALPNGRLSVVPGNHMSAVTKPDLGREIASFLSEATTAL
jgi:pimeloyl-ACP methyl ester carboxylesterase